MDPLHTRIDRLRQRYQAAPTSKAFAPLADLLRQDDQHEEALALLEEGLARHPDYLSAMVILGRTLLDAQRCDHGRKVLVRVLDLDPENFVALRVLTEDAVRQELWDVAVPWLEQLVQVEPEDMRWTRLLLRAREQSAEPSATADPASVHAEVSGTSLATMTLVDVYLEQGYLTQALAALRLIQEREPDRPDVKTKMAEVLALLDEQPGQSGGAEGSGIINGTSGVSETRGRKGQLARKRTQDKQRFNDWVQALRPEGDRPS